MTNRRTLLVAIALISIAPALMGAESKGCGGAAFSMTEAPDAAGQWDVTYDNSLSVEISIGGALYTEELDVVGGAFTIDHEGQPINFDLDCTREEVICPSEAWPATVGIRQDDASYPHRTYLQMPRQECDMELVAADPAECGEGTLNEDCADVCPGEFVAGMSEHFGVIDEAGERWDVLLGGTAATNGVSCAMLGISVASADLVTTGVSMEEDWEAVAMDNGEVTTAYAGGCLWAGDIGDDGTIEAAVVGATIVLRTGFTAAKQL